MKQKNIGQIRCQRCLTANSLGQELCVRCGTRLMLVVVPTAARYEDQEAPAAPDEHLLERVSILENRLARITDHLQRTVDMMYRQTLTAEKHYELVNTLIEMLIEAKVFDQAEFQNKWNERSKSHTEAVKTAERDTRRRKLFEERVLKAYQGRRRTTFHNLVSEGFELLAKGKVTPGLRSLEQAAALAPDNKPLQAFIGEHFFRVCKPLRAKDRLKKAFDTTNPDYGVCLMLGLLCADSGESDQARILLSEAIERRKNSFAAHYALGLLHAVEDNWTDALAEFKRAARSRVCPEGYYVAGFACFQLDRNRLAQRYLGKAIEMDANYAEAWYVLGLARLKAGERKAALEAFTAALATGNAEPRYQAAARISAKSNLQSLPPPRSLYGNARHKGKRLLTTGDPRVATAVRQDALEHLDRALTQVF